jgi:L-ascorbate metabolism protein UlaG (beta-lactamase superfamily)
VDTRERGDRRTRVTWVGHSTVLVEMDGLRILTDPILRSRVVHLRRAAELDVRAVDEVDVVLVSHLHFDHLDLHSLERLGHSTPILVPRGAAQLLKRWGFESVTELDDGEGIRIGDITVRATHAEHRGRRRPFGARAPALGYLIAGSTSVYFAGDTDLFDGMSSLAEALDLALLPIWGWGPSIGAGHLDPRRAAEALLRLEPRVAVPIHWGTYRPVQLGRERPAFLVEPAKAFEHLAAAIAPMVRVEVLPVGGSLELEA